MAKLFVVKSAFAATLILTIGLAGAAYPLLPRHLSLAALFTIGIPVLRAGPRAVHRPPAAQRLHADLMRFSVPGGVVSALAVLSRAFARSVSAGRGGRAAPWRPSCWC